MASSLITFSFDSLPGIDDLNSYDMPHSKKLVNAKEAFKVCSILRTSCKSANAIAKAPTN